MRSTTFCLHLRGDTVTSRRIYDAVAGGCIPVLVASKGLGPNLPFIFDSKSGGSGGGGGSGVRYWEWSLSVAEDDFTKDPIGALDRINDRFFGTGAKGLRELAAMQEALVRDAPKILFCSGRHGISFRENASVAGGTDSRQRCAKPECDCAWFDAGTTTGCPVG